MSIWKITSSFHVPKSWRTLVLGINDVNDVDRKLHDICGFACYCPYR